MSSIELAFVFTFLAGFSTMIGIIPIFIRLKSEDKIIAGALSFAAGVMICVSVTDLIPEAISLIKSTYRDFFVIVLVFVFMIIGMFVTLFLDKKVNVSMDNNSLYRVGIISMLVIILHNIPEGIATFISTGIDTSLGLSLTLAISIHNIPEGISIAVPIYYATKSKIKAFIYTFISALSEPLGAILAYLFLTRFITDSILGILFSFIAGVMLYISFMELLPTSRSYKYSLITKIFFIIGFVFILLKYFI